MLNLLQRYRHRALSRSSSKQDYVRYFLSQPEHAWIGAHAGVQRCFDELFLRVPLALVADLLRNPFCFVPSSEFQEKGTARYQMKNTIVVFPEYEQLLREGEGAGIAFLAHELAMVLYELEDAADKDPLMAEVEADKFVCDLGLADELEQLLLAQDESDGKRLRLTYLTLNSFGVDN
jgi:hypothetical protein